MEHTKGKLHVVSDDLKFVEDEQGRDVIVCLGRSDDGIMPKNISTQESEANARRVVNCWNSHDELLAACEGALPLIAGERIANDSFPPTDDLGRVLAKNMRECEKQLEQAIAAAQNGLNGKTG